MKLLLALCLGGLGLTAPALAALEFSAYIQTDGGVKFALTDLESGEKSGWMGLGGTFSGQVVKEFDAMTEVLVVERAGVTQRLTLKESRVQHRAAELPPGIEFKVVITDDGRVTLDGQAVTWAELESRLRTGQPARNRITLSVQSRVSVEFLETVMKTILRAGVVRFSFHATSTSAATK